MAKAVIDISKWNIINNYKLLADACDGIIIRIGFRSYEAGKITIDPRFDKHINELKRLNIPLGVYFFTTAINADEGKEEALWVLDTIKKYNINLSFPIAVDSEFSNDKHSGRSDKLDKETRTNAVMGFVDTVKANGKECMIYASDSWYRGNFVYDRVKNELKWVARYSNAKPVTKDNVLGWQKTDVFAVAGVTGNFDLSEWYADIKVKEPKSGVSGKAIINHNTESDKNVSIIKAGDERILNSVPLYSSATGPKCARELTGTYYIWSSDIKNNRVRFLVFSSK